MASRAGVKWAEERRAPAGNAGLLDRGAEFALALETASRGIHDPVAKLRYIRGSLARYRLLVRCVETLPLAPLRRLLYGWLSLEGMRHLVSANPLGAPLDGAVRRRLVLSRAATAAAALVIAAVAVAAAGYRPARTAPPAPARAASANATLPPVAEPLPPLPPGVQPAGVWVVEKGAGWEQYSNGLRIDTSFAVAGEPRRYRNFAVGGGMLEAVEQKPVGILFHTSESDVWPLDAANNERLRDSSHRLLRYVQRLRLYNYVIDRFGRVFRVVEEESRANHAGNSIWRAGDTVYLNLNSAFLGVCFETRWDGGRALPITAAQLAAGRSLTEYLRQRWEIPAELCVTHGLTSVNPVKHLIGHHVDWARGFPFEAFGLPNQYRRTAPSVELFGFGYDDDFLKAVGEPWAGVREGERELVAAAERRGASLEQVRRDRQALYDRWRGEQLRDEELAPAVPADRAGRSGSVASGAAVEHQTSGLAPSRPGRASVRDRPRSAGR